MLKEYVEGETVRTLIPKPYEPPDSLQVMMSTPPAINLLWYRI